MARTLGPNGLYTTTLKLEELAPPSDQTIWYCAQLSARVVAAIEAEIKALQSEGRVDAELSERVFRAGLRGWKNLRDDSGNELAYRTEPATLFGIEMDAVAQDLVLRLPREWVNELALRMTGSQHLSEEERGN